MAVQLRSKLNSSILLLCVAAGALVLKATSPLTPTKVGNDELKHFRSLQSVSLPSAPPPPQVRLHPGVIASVLIVSVAAALAAACIIKKYCFPQSDVTYRYSMLRQMEEQRASREEDESDQDLLD